MSQSAGGRSSEALLSRSQQDERGRRNYRNILHDAQNAIQQGHVPDRKEEDGCTSKSARPEELHFTVECNHEVIDNECCGNRSSLKHWAVPVDLELAYLSLNIQ